ncbi:MAG: pyrroline-5-carboxylate reductase [Rhodomicrobiaceae bacterium]
MMSILDDGLTDNSSPFSASFSPVLVVGAGKMAGAILSAWLEPKESLEGLDPETLYVEDPGSPDDVLDLLAKYDVVPKARQELPTPPQLVMVGVKPQIMDGVLKDLASRISSETLVYSIAAGRTLSDIAKHLPEGTAIVRAMPNTPVMVQNGMTALIANEFVSPKQRSQINDLVSGTGTVAWLDNESQMDAVTAVSGSGPAYIFWLAECLAKAGERQGLSPELAMTLSKATIDGAGSMMGLFDIPPSQLRENVTSKGGTTAAALEVLMNDEGLAPLIDAAIEAAAKRSKELSG